MASPLRFLLIDDNPSDRLLVKRELQRSFDPLMVQEINTASDFKRALATDDFDAVITDFQLRWAIGLDILADVKQHYPQCPVIMFTNTGTEEIAVEAMKLGLDDYIIKQPNHYMRVPIAVQTALERQAAQRQAALVEIRLQGLLNQVKIGIFRTRLDGSLLEVNPAFLELLGAESLEQVDQLNLLDIRDRYSQLSNLPPPQQLEQEMQLQRRGGKPFWALLTLTLNVVEGATVIDGLLEDISDRKAAQAALQQLNATLEAQVQERTAQLQAANQDLEAFAYSVSHDLQAPLRAIQGFAKALAEDASEVLTATHLEYLQRIGASAAQLGILIQDLLTYSRIGQTVITLAPISLSQVVTAALNQLEAEIQARQAHIQLEEPLPTVQVNRLFLTQAISNLIGNAIKFVAAGVQPHVRIWAESLPQQTRLWIEDNGIGIPAEYQQTIFQPFTRLHGQEEYAGSGVGLATVRKSIERMGGTVGVESQPGQGSRFWITLPTAVESL